MDVTTNNTKSKVNIRLLVGTGMLSGLAFVLQYLEFPIPIMPFFIRFTDENNYLCEAYQCRTGTAD